MSTQPTLPPSIPAEEEHALLARIEASLAEEVRRLANALGQFGLRAQAISKEFPAENTMTEQLITLAFSMGSLEFGNALLMSLIRGSLFEDEGGYFKKLGLQLNDAFLKLDFEGQLFLAVALTDEAVKCLPENLKCVRGIKHEEASMKNGVGEGAKP